MVSDDTISLLRCRVLTPVLVSLLNKTSKLADSGLLISLIIVAVVFPSAKSIMPESIHGVYDRLCLPHLYIYVFGLLMSKYFENIRFNWMSIVACLLFSILFAFNDCIILSVLSFCVSIIGMSFSFGCHRIQNEFSYSLYLWHMAIISFVSAVVPYSDVVIFLLAITISTIIAFFSYLLFEKRKF